MSSGAKEVMIKSVAQAIPTYTMSVFKLPAGCDELEQMVSNFWLGDEPSHRKVYWIAWDNLLYQKDIIWRIGSGSKVQIWQDSWIPRLLSLKLSGRKVRTRLRWVSQLMIPGRREWDLNVLRSCLLPHDVHEVRKIHLSDRTSEDMIA
jgi:hypothetical protein